MRIGFTGTSEGMTQEQRTQLFLFISNLMHEESGKKGTVEFHHGMCEGADDEFHQITAHYSAGPIVKIIGHPGVTKNGFAWKRGGEVPKIVLPEKEYIPRNHDIVEATEILLASPKEMNVRRTDRFRTWTPIRSGTWATIRYAEMRKKRVVIFWPDGTVTEGRK